MSGSGETAQERQARFESDIGPLVAPLRRFLRRRTDADTAEDVLAETLLVCWRRIEELPDAPLPWAYATARNCLANAERGTRRRARLASRLMAMSPRAEEAGGPAKTHEAAGSGAALIPAALAKLAAADAEVLRLWAWEDLRAAEIAEVLAITPNAASIRLHRAKQRLRRALTRMESDPARKEDGPAGHVPPSRRDPS